MKNFKEHRKNALRSLRRSLAFDSEITVPEAFNRLVRFNKFLEEDEVLKAQATIQSFITGICEWESTGRRNAKGHLIYRNPKKPFSRKRKIKIPPTSPLGRIYGVLLEKAAAVEDSSFDDDLL